MPGDLFIEYCSNGNINDAIDLYNNDKINVMPKIYIAFKQSCINGHFETAQWLYSVEKIDVFITYPYLFQKCCRNGKLTIMKWIHSLYDFILTDQILNTYNCAFKIACKHGNLDIAKWLYSLGCINIHFERDMSFQCSCIGGHFEIAKWLYSFKNVNIHVNKDHIYAISKINGHENICDWLLTLQETDGYIDIHSNNEYIFSYFCICNKLTQAQKWYKYCLNINSPINIRVNNDNIFLSCCEFSSHQINLINVINWLCKICPNTYFIETQDNKILKHGISTEKQNNDKYIKKKIPKALKRQIWLKKIGNNIEGKCYVCSRIIYNDDHECGHIIAEVNGGETTLENLIPICKNCNRSCHTKNLDEFKKVVIGEVSICLNNNQSNTLYNKKQIKEVPRGHYNGDKRRDEKGDNAPIFKSVTEPEPIKENTEDGEKKEEIIIAICNKRKSAIKK